MNTILVCRDEDQPEYFIALFEQGGDMQLEASRPGDAAHETRKLMGLDGCDCDWAGQQWDIQVPEWDVPRHLRPGTKPV
jgi:hypothetical protein